MSLVSQNGGESYSHLVQSVTSLVERVTDIGRRDRCVDLCFQFLIECVRTDSGVEGGGLPVGVFGKFYDVVDEDGRVSAVRGAVGALESVRGATVSCDADVGGTETNVCGDKLWVGSFQDDKGDHVPGTRFGSFVGDSRGNLKREKKNRPGKKQRARLARKFLAKGVVGDQSEVPEWRRKGEFEKTEAQKSLEEKWTVKNRLDTLKLKEQLKAQELRAGNPRLSVPKIWTEADEEAAYRAKMAKIKSDTAKYVADEAYWKKRAEKGAVEKAIDLEIEIMDGQLSGKYDVFADKRTIGWAKTVKTNSSASSGANKTVWSGSGASKVSNAKSSVEHSIVSIEKHEELLKRLAVTESELIKVTEEARKYKTLGARAAAALKKQQKDKDEQEQWENSLYY